MPAVFGTQRVTAPAYRPATLLAVLSLLLLGGCPSGSGDNLDGNGRPVDDNSAAEPVPPAADFNAIQANVLTPVCTVCHAGAAAPVGLRLDAANSFDMLVGVSSVQVPGLLRVAPGDPDNSYLVQKIEGTAAIGARMPLGGPFLSADTNALLREWISNGAQPPSQAPPVLPPTVLSVVPANGATLATAPDAISAVFSKDMDTTLVGDMTFTLTAAGGDGGFAEGNETAVTATSISLSTTDPTTVTLDLAGVTLADDAYQVRLIGSGALALADLTGLLLDGDGDGIGGDDFVASFTLDTAPAAPDAAWRSIQDVVFTPLCTQCHSDGGIAQFLLLDEANSYAALVGVPSTEVATLLRVAPQDADNSYLVQKIEGSAAVGERMPLGGAPLPAATNAAIRAWIDAGAVMNPGDPIPDFTPPVVALNVPAGPLVGTVTLAADASDASGVSAVSFFVDDVLIDTATVSPYAVSWDTTLVANGDHVITARADDTAGNGGAADPITVSVDNPPPPDVTAPIVSIVNPGSPLAGGVTISVDSSDNVGVTQVRLFVDGVAQGFDNVAPYQFDWDTLLVANGDHVLVAEADDAAGNTALSDSVTITVDNGAPPDVTAPVVAIVDPGSPTAGTVNLTVDASDAVGVTVVRLFVDGVLLGSDTTTPYEFAWDTTQVADGDRVLSAEADDAAGNTGSAAPLTVTVANGGPEATLAWIQDNVFTPNCTTGCHSAGNFADFLLLDAANAFSELVNAPATEHGGGPPEFRVLPGDPDNSALVQRLEGTLLPAMPLNGNTLPQNQIDAVRQWIADGAPSGNADVTAPVVTLSVPATPLLGTVTLTATAVDDVGVTELRFLVDGIVSLVLNAPPYEFQWDTTAVADGDHTLSVEADDAAGNTGSSSSVIVAVDNGPPSDVTAPTVSVTDPGSPALGIVVVVVAASDDVGVTAVRLFVDGALLGSDAVAPYQFDWDTTQLGNGDHVLTAEADDAAGNTGNAAAVTVSVDNPPPPDVTAPAVAIVDPGSPGAGTVTLTVDASDDVGVTIVRLFVDGALLGSDTTTPYEFAWDTTQAVDGDHVLSAEADDAAGNTGTAVPLTVTVANGGPAATLTWIQDNIFTPSCTTGCHSAGNFADFLLLDPANAFSELVNVEATRHGGGPPEFRVLPGDADNSALVQRLEGTLEELMPLFGTPLPQAQIDAVRAWIDAGAPQN